MTQDAYQSAVEKLIVYLDQTVNFAQTQLPEVAQEMLAWGIQGNTIGMWVGGGVALVLIILAFLAMMSDDGGLPAVFLIIGAIFGLIVTLGSYVDLKKIETAPKLYLLEKTRDLVAGDAS